MACAVHRVVEQRAAATPDAIAIVDGARIMTYSELNQRANALARRLRDSGLTRVSLALVTMPRSVDLAAILLAVLKAGAAYAWIEPGSTTDLTLPSRLCILQPYSGQEDKFLAVDIDRLLRDATSGSGPNLPVLTRNGDVACVLPDGTGRPNVLVPHETITALPRLRAVRQNWDGCAGALDLWVALMSGVTIAVGIASPVTAAA